MPEVRITIEIEAEEQELEGTETFSLYDLETRIKDAAVDGIVNCGGYDQRINYIDGDHMSIMLSGEIEVDISEDIEDARQAVADMEGVDLLDVNVEDVGYSEYNEEATLWWTVTKEDEPLEAIRTLDLEDLRAVSRSGASTADLLEYLFGAAAAEIITGESR